MRCGTPRDECTISLESNEEAEQNEEVAVQTVAIQTI